MPEPQSPPETPSGDRYQGKESAHFMHGEVIPQHVVEVIRESAVAKPYMALRGSVPWLALWQRLLSGFAHILFGL